MPITLPKKPDNIATGKRRYIKLDSDILLKHNKIKNSIIASMADINIPKNSRLDDCKVHEITDPNIADIPEANKTKANKNSVGIEMLIITNDEIVNTTRNEKRPIDKAVMIFFKALLSFFIFFVILSE